MKSLAEFLNEGNNVLSNTETMIKGMQKAYDKKWKPTGVDVYSIQKGRKYLKIVATREDGDGGHVVAFVDKTTGDIYKPAGWKAPAKHSRGNVNDNYGKSALDNSGYSIRYL